MHREERPAKQEVSLTYDPDTLLRGFIFKNRPLKLASKNIFA